MTRFTVLGGRGFIGSHLAAYLTARGFECAAPPRDADLAELDLGIVFYAIGLTADFRQRPLDAVEAHVSRFAEVVRGARFESIVYLSSTRVYRNGGGTSEETPIVARPSELDELYNLTKAMGESIAINAARHGRVARLANVYGADPDSSNFLTSIIRDAVKRGAVTLQTALTSSKDYIAIDEVCELLVRIALEGRHSIYNVASGAPTTHEEIVAELRRITGCRVEVVSDAPVVRDAPIDVSRIESEFGFHAARLPDRLEETVSQCRAAIGAR